MRFVQNEDSIDFVSEVPVCSNSCGESEQELDELSLSNHRAGFTFAESLSPAGGGTLLFRMP
jgi:hypothetical protein